MRGYGLEVAVNAYCLVFYFEKSLLLPVLDFVAFLKVNAHQDHQMFSVIDQDPEGNTVASYESFFKLS